MGLIIIKIAIKVKENRRREIIMHRLHNMSYVIEEKRGGEMGKRSEKKENRGKNPSITQI